MNRRDEEKNMNNTQKMTGYPSIDKPWLKWYTQEALDASLPECTIDPLIDKPWMQWYGEETRHLPKCDNVNVYHNSKLVI